jgi:hypothetical protein
MTNGLSVFFKVCVKIAGGDWHLASVHKHCGSMCLCTECFCHLTWTTAHNSLVLLAVLPTWHTQKQTGVELYHGYYQWHFCWNKKVAWLWERGSFIFWRSVGHKAISVYKTWCAVIEQYKTSCVTRAGSRFWWAWSLFDFGGPGYEIEYKITNRK